MALIPWNATVQDDDGNFVPLPVVTVRNAADDTLASIYDMSGVAASNPLTGLANGFVQFQVQPGRYTIEGALDGSTTATWEWEAVGNTWYPSRAALVDAVTDGASWPDGTIVTVGLAVLAEPIIFVAKSGEDAFSDIPGLKPAGVLHLEHWKDNATPGTTDMAPALQAAIAWLDDVGGSAFTSGNTGYLKSLDLEYYFATGSIIPNTLDGLHISGRGKGTVWKTDQNITLLNIGPDLSGGGDTSTSGPTYGTQIDGISFVNTKLDSTNVAIQANRCPNSRIDNCQFINWYIGILGYRFNQSTISRVSFFNTSRTTAGRAFVELNGVYDSTNSHTPGGGIHLTEVEMVGNVLDPTMQTNGILVNTVDGLYLHSGHIGQCVNGLHVTPDGSSDNKVITDIFVGTPWYFDDPADGGKNVFITGTVSEGSLYQSIWFSGTKFRGANKANYGVVVSITDSGTFDGEVKNIMVNGGEFKQHKVQAFRVEGANTGKVPVKYKINGAEFDNGNTGNTAATSYIYSEAKSAHVTGCVFNAEDNAATRAVYMVVSEDGDTVVLSDNDFSRVISGKGYDVIRNASGNITITNNNPKGGTGEYQNDGFRATTSGFDPKIIWEFDLTQNNQMLDVVFHADGTTTDANDNYGYFEYRFIARRNNAGAVSQIVKTELAAGTNLVNSDKPAGVGLLTGTTWTNGMAVTAGTWVTNAGNVYAVVKSDGTAGATAPTHTSGAQLHDGVRYLYLGAIDTSKAVAYVSGEADGSNKAMNWQTRITASANP